MSARVFPDESSRPRLGAPAILSLALHASLLVLVIVAGRTPRGAMPPIYRVELIPAPKGPPAVGAVTETAAPEPTPTPRRAEAPVPTKAPVPKTKAPPARKQVAKATPVPDAKSSRFDEPAPKAAGGAEGGQGADVAAVRFEGVDFPYPAYLQNIVRQIRLRFNPRPGAPLTAEIAFIIRSDGSVTGIRFLRRSGQFAFDAEAQGAIESAGNVRAFGPLPEGFTDEVLPVIFSFSPQLIR